MEKILRLHSAAASALLFSCKHANTFFNPTVAPPCRQFNGASTPRPLLLLLLLLTPHQYQILPLQGHFSSAVPKLPAACARAACSVPPGTHHLISMLCRQNGRPAIADWPLLGAWRCCYWVCCSTMTNASHSTQHCWLLYVLF